jgi:DNA-(apurinic or apyrimidinic site) lyase
MLYQKYPFGTFAVTMVTLGLNDFQLKGKADEVYWPRIQNILGNSEAPATPGQLIAILKPFYQAERLNELKSNRLDRFLKSELVNSLWPATPRYIAEEFEAIWMSLSILMNQEPGAKTIVFAMKCLGISLLMYREYGFDFSRIPIPVDSRIEALTQEVASKEFKGRQDIQDFWSEILWELKKELPRLSMIHLESLCWQIGTLSYSEMRAYFERLGLREIGENIIRIIRAKNGLH